MYTTLRFDLFYYNIMIYVDLLGNGLLVSMISREYYLQEKIDYAAIVENLGGVFYDTQYFTQACTHVVVGKIWYFVNTCVVRLCPAIRLVSRYECLSLNLLFVTCNCGSYSYFTLSRRYPTTELLLLRGHDCLTLKLLYYARGRCYL